MTDRITTKTHGQLAILNWRTLSDERAANVRPWQEIRRAAVILTGACNFACPYCQTLGGDKAPTIDKDFAFALIESMLKYGLRELRLSGGEPTLIPWLPDLVEFAVSKGIRVAVSTNGYAPERIYSGLVAAGVTEFSISLDSVDPAEADRLSGGHKNVLVRVLGNIQAITDLGAEVYIGMTCCSASRTPQQMQETVEKVAELGVTDIKIMSPAQEGEILDTTWLSEEMAAKFPFLAWRSQNFKCGRDVRGLQPTDSHKCPLVLDDVTIAGEKHYPCNVYLREGGEAIGEIQGSYEMLAERAAWNETHDTHKDPICSTMCMDLLRTYNNRVRELQFANPSEGEVTHGS